jgi:predicted 3-demethylubiquinone-9 3-methyltransferase (glyoxalase superfamily)
MTDVTQSQTTQTQLPQTQVTPCLWFDDAAEQAAEYYVSLLDNSRITHVERYGEGGPQPAGSAFVVSFELQGRPFVALNGGPQFTFNEAVSLQLSCPTQDEVDRLWAAITAEGGAEGQCGWAKDRWGLWWQVIPAELPSLLGDPDQGRAQRAMSAMLAMTRIDLAAMRAAADQEDSPA